MQMSCKSIVACAFLGAALLATAACSPRPIPPKSVTDLMEDRVTLDGVMMKCNENQSKARTDAECLNARIAVERLASQREPVDQAKLAEEFERSRDQLRSSQEKLRQEQQAKTKVDVYKMPVVPVEPPPPPPPAPPANDASPPVARESNR
jgi:uncharacterized protein YaiL (DUF2058 family)